MIVFFLIFTFFLTVVLVLTTSMVTLRPSVSGVVTAGLTRSTPSTASLSCAMASATVAAPVTVADRCWPA